MTYQMYMAKKKMAAVWAWALTVMLFPSSGLAASESGGLSSVAKEPGSLGQLLQVTFGLLAVLVIIFVVAWSFRRLGTLQASAGGSMRILGGLSMGQRERVMLVQVGDTQLLLGVAPGRVQTLHVLDKPIEVPGGDGGHDGESFAERLRTALKQGGKR